MLTTCRQMTTKPKTMDAAMFLLSRCTLAAGQFYDRNRVERPGEVAIWPWIWYRGEAGTSHIYPIHVHRNMTSKKYAYTCIKMDKNTCSLFPRYTHLDGIFSCRKSYWIISWFLSGNNKERDKGQIEVLRFTTTGDWNEGYLCIL